MLGAIGFVTGAVDVGPRRRRGKLMFLRWLLAPAVAVSIAVLPTSFHRRPADEFSKPAFPGQDTSQRGLAACLVSSTGK